MSTTEIPARAAARPDPAAMAALRTGVALARELFADRLDLAGLDRVRFLQNLVTCDVAALGAGSNARGFLTHAKGGVLADAAIAALEDRFRLRLPAGRGEAVAAHLLKYRIADRVEVERRDDLAGALVRGARAPELLAALDGPALGAGEHAAFALGGRSLRLSREARDGEPRFELEAAASDLPAIAATIARAGERFGLSEIGAAELELARIEDGELAWGVDYGEENFPQESGDEAAVSFTKGCYLGQEVVARIQYRGGVQRLPRRLELSADVEVARGTELVAADGRAAGRISSVAFSADGARQVALGLVHRRAAEPGTKLQLAGGSTATVMALAPAR